MSVLENGQKLGVCHNELTCIFRTTVFSLGLQLVGLDVFPKLLGNFGTLLLLPSDFLYCLSYTKLIHPEWVKGIICVFLADKDNQISTNVNKSSTLSK